MKKMDFDIQMFAIAGTTPVYYKNDGTEESVSGEMLSAANEDTLVTKACPFTREGYTFIKYNTAADGSGKDFLAETSYTHDEYYSYVTGTTDAATRYLNLYAQWQSNAETANKIVTLENLTRYDNKIKEYIGSPYRVNLLSNYITPVESTGSQYTKYALNESKILSEEFSGKLFNDVSGTVGYEGTTQYLLDRDFIEIFCIRKSNGGHKIVIYNGYSNKIEFDLDSTGKLTGGDYTKIVDYKESGIPEVL